MAATPTVQHAREWRESALPGTAAFTAESGGERPRAYLRQLVTMRLVAIAAQLVTVAAADRLLAVDLPLLAILAVLMALALYNVRTERRLREDPRPVTDAELLRQLSVDTLALTSVLALSGGASNPFAGIILLPLALGASALTPARGWTLAAESIAAYAALLYVAHPIQISGAEADRMMLFAAGHVVSFSITAGVIVTVIVRAAIALRRNEQILATTRRKVACDEHILRIGALAAGTAHELSSPLSSIATIVEDLRASPASERDLQHDLNIVVSQLATCRETLSTLLCYGNSAFCSPSDRLGLDELLRTVIQDFRTRRPPAQISLGVESPGRAPELLANRALRQALTNLLDNAADASAKPIEVSIAWDPEWLHIRIRDRGPGVPPDVVDRLGRLLFYTTKERGRGSGLGLYLANTAVMRMGGALDISNAPGEGALCHITLPATQPNA